LPCSGSVRGTRPRATWNGFVACTNTKPTINQNGLLSSFQRPIPSRRLPGPPEVWEFRRASCQGSTRSSRECAYKGCRAGCQRRSKSFRRTCHLPTQPPDSQPFSELEISGGPLVLP
jgi:hypothetical protein